MRIPGMNCMRVGVSMDVIRRKILKRQSQETYPSNEGSFKNLSERSNWFVCSILPYFNFGFLWFFLRGAVINHVSIFSQFFDLPPPPPVNKCQHRSRPPPPYVTRSQHFLEKSLYSFNKNPHLKPSRY